jgi:phage protein U
MTAKSTTMMALGGFRFSLPTSAYTELERNNAWRWPSQDRIGRAPALQFVGRGEETISMRGTIYPTFIAQRAGLEQLPAMRAAADLGEPLLMVSGSGRVYGLMCITSIREGQKVFFSDGTPRSIEFDTSLSAYGGD